MKNTNIPFSLYGDNDNNDISDFCDYSSFYEKIKLPNLLNLKKEYDNLGNVSRKKIIDYLEEDECTLRKYEEKLIAIQEENFNNNNNNGFWCTGPSCTTTCMIDELVEFKSKYNVSKCIMDGFLSILRKSTN